MFTNNYLKSILHNNNNNTQQISNVLPQCFSHRQKTEMGDGKLHGANVGVFHSINASTEVARF
jgi:hypothetical protein